MTITAPAPATTRPDPQAKIEAKAVRHIEEEFASHVLTVHLDDEHGHRRLSFRTPGTSFWAFELITWPGYLTVAGDFGHYTWHRNTDEDMFAMFRGPVGRINDAYWSQKLISSEEPIDEYSPEQLRIAFDELIEAYTDDADASLREELRRRAAAEIQFVNSVDEAYATLDEFDELNVRFDDVFEHSVTIRKFRYLLALYAVVWAIDQYDRRTA